MNKIRWTGVCKNCKELLYSYLIEKNGEFMCPNDCKIFGKSPIESIKEKLEHEHKWWPTERRGKTVRITRTIWKKDERKWVCDCGKIKWVKEDE